MPLPRAPLLALAAMLVAATAGATTVRTGQPAASQPSARAWATREQLRDCLATEDALKARFRAIDASNAAHQKLFDQVDAESTRLQSLQGQLDHDSDTAIAAFNALVKDHNLHVRQLNQDAADSQPATDAYNTDMAAFNHRCSGQTYRVDDMAAVMKERRQAAAVAGAASAP